MSKTFVDEFIKHMKLAGMVTKVSPWMVEGFGEKQMNVRYVGVTIKDDWVDIFSPKNNFLLKFIINRTSAYAEFSIANKPPFFRFASRKFSNTDKWESFLGDIKRRLKKDKIEFQNHTDKIGNLYVAIVPYLKS